MRNRSSKCRFGCAGSPCSRKPRLRVHAQHDARRGPSASSPALSVCRYSAAAVERHHQLAAVVLAEQPVLDLGRGHADQRLGVLLARAAVRRGVQHARPAAPSGSQRPAPRCRSATRNGRRSARRHAPSAAGRCAPRCRARWCRAAPRPTASRAGCWRCAPRCESSGRRRCRAARRRGSANAMRKLLPAIWCYSVCISASASERTRCNAARAPPSAAASSTACIGGRPLRVQPQVQAARSSLRKSPPTTRSARDSSPRPFSIALPCPAQSLASAKPVIMASLRRPHVRCGLLCADARCARSSQAVRTLASASPKRRSTHQASKMPDADACSETEQCGRFAGRSASQQPPARHAARKVTAFQRRGLTRWHVPCGNPGTAVGRQRGARPGEPNA